MHNESVARIHVNVTKKFESLVWRRCDNREAGQDEWCKMPLPEGMDNLCA